MAQSIVVVDPLTEKNLAKLRHYVPLGFSLSCANARGDLHLKELIADADYAISGQVGVGGDVMRAARKLKLLHKWGVGVDNFDLEAARACGIKVARTTGSNAVPVAEFTLGLMLATLRHIANGHADLRGGAWRGVDAQTRETFMLSGKTVGLIGFGAIGKAVARLLQGFGCTILYHKPNRLSDNEERAFGARYAPLSELLARSDIVSLHCPMTPETKNLIDCQALAAMKRSAILVNVARGGVVVEDDLVRALRDGTIHAAAMDVFAVEPLPANSKLVGIDNLILTPHLAAIAADNYAPTVNRMFANILAVSRGEPLPPGDVVV